MYFLLNILQSLHANIQANRKMQEQLDAALKERDDALKSGKQKQKSITTPTPKVSAPSPASSHKSDPVAKGKAAQRAPEPNEADQAEGSEPEELSMGAKLGRLRRLCERKPSGKLNVPEEVHSRWAQKGKARDDLLEELEACDWDPDKGWQIISCSNPSTCSMFIGVGEP